MSSYLIQKYLESYAINTLIFVNPICFITISSHDMIKYYTNKWIHSINIDSQAVNKTISLSNNTLVIDNQQYNTSIESILKRYYGLPDNSNIQNLGIKFLRSNCFPTMKSEPYNLDNNTTNNTIDYTSELAINIDKYYKNYIPKQILFQELNNLEVFMNNPKIYKVNLESLHIPTMITYTNMDNEYIQSNQEYNHLKQQFNVSNEDCINIDDVYNLYNNNINSTSNTTTTNNNNINSTSNNNNSIMLLSDRVPMISKSEVFNKTIYDWIETVT